MVEGSFHDLADGNQAISETSMGVTNMTAEALEWPLDADGEEGTLALLAVTFENMAPEDIEKVNVQLSGGLIVAQTKTRVIDGQTYRWYFIPASYNVDVTFHHERFGSERLTVDRFLAKHIYVVHVRNATTVSVSVTSTPVGARVLFDGQELQHPTPCTIPNVMMGLHKIALVPANPKMAHSIPEQTIEVSASQAAFNYDMLKRKTVTIKADPTDSHLKVLLNEKIVAEGQGQVILENVPYGPTYQIIGTYKEAELPDDITINDETPEEYTVKVIGSRSISFLAKQYNSTVNGADVTINGRSVGVTPLTRVLDYGTYTVDMAYSGYHKSKKLMVNKKTTECMIRIPNKKRVAYNPFRVDYHKRAWGIAFSYINRYYKFKVGGQSKKYNWVGEEGTSNGVQAGIAYQPYFGTGQGLSTGLFWQGTFGSSKENKDISYIENAVYFPLQYQFRLPLTPNFSVCINAGAALTYGISNKWKNDDEEYDVGYGHNDEYGTYHPESLDYSLLFGAAIQFKALQIEGKYSIGLKDHDVMYTKEGDEKVSYKSGFWGIGISLLF